MEKLKKPLILIAGPTASGKTSTSVQLAKRIDGEIISVDSMQVYKRLDIGTAKVKEEEKEGIPHYMVDEFEPDFNASVAVFKERVNYYLDKIYAKGKVPILVGGTGFYINAILYDTEFIVTQEEHKYRDKVRNYLNDNGIEALHTWLREIDPESADTIHPNNTKRVCRAIEYFLENNEKISTHNKKEKEKRKDDESKYDYSLYVLNMDRDILYDRINKRIDIMIEEGLLEEAKMVYGMNLPSDAPAIKAIGYKELFPYFENQMTLDECIEELKKATRNYAKRQLTWFRNQTKSTFIDITGKSVDEVVDFIINNSSCLRK